MKLLCVDDGFPRWTFLIIICVGFEFFRDAFVTLPLRPPQQAGSGIPRLISGPFWITTNSSAFPKTILDLKLGFPSHSCGRHQKWRTTYVRRTIFSIHSLDSVSPETTPPLQFNKFSSICHAHTHTLPITSKERHPQYLLTRLPVCPDLMSLYKIKRESHCPCLGLRSSPTIFHNEVRVVDRTRFHVIHPIHKLLPVVNGYTTTLPFAVVCPLLELMHNADEFNVVIFFGRKGWTWTYGRVKNSQFNS